ncbi:hypothetical protein LSAT2_028914 [Lamellibrachia satsuma]|nr:hypothetical protein LSAT2_028914 [Lamellibrachia satsuma]
MCTFPRYSALDGVDSVTSTRDACSDVCEHTYPPHTYEKVNVIKSCQRGCRLFAIIELMDSCGNKNHTIEACIASCKDAYDDMDNAKACELGCANQPSNHPVRQLGDDASMYQSQNMYPFLYVHSVYSNMIEKLMVHSNIYWSFYMQPASGQMVVIKYEPEIYIEQREIIMNDNGKTSSFIESNIVAVDNSATPHLHQSQLHAVEKDISIIDNGQAVDWMGCIVKKTGLPRVLLTFTILLSATMMIWLCISSAVTAPDQRVSSTEPQKLSLYGDGDLDDDDDLPDCKELAAVHNSVSTGPLPHKLQLLEV